MLKLKLLIISWSMLLVSCVSVPVVPQKPSMDRIATEHCAWQRMAQVPTRRNTGPRFGNKGIQLRDKGRCAWADGNTYRRAADVVGDVRDSHVQQPADANQRVRKREKSAPG